MEYDFYSNDWDNVDLLLCEHMRGETLYMEQMSRWALQHGRAWGVVHIGPNDFKVNGDSDGYEIALRCCKAITRHGYIVDVDPGRLPLTLQGTNKPHGDATEVPVYLRVGVQKVGDTTGASQSGALLDRPVLAWNYDLSVEPASARHDWIQIGRMKKVGQRFVRDGEFIPQCVHLKSYPALLKIALAITQEAERAMRALDGAANRRSDGSDSTPAWLSLVGVMITTLAPATILIDRDTHPRRYMQQLVTVLRAYQSLLPLLKAVSNNWSVVIPPIRKVMAALETGAVGNAARAIENNEEQDEQEQDEEGQGYGRSAPLPAARGEFEPEETRPGTLWWDGFDLILKAFQALTTFFGELTPSFVGSTPIPPPEKDSDLKRERMPVKQIVR